MKWCPGCGEDKDKGEFYRDSRRRDGLRGWCKRCSKADKKRYRSTEHGRQKTREADAKYRRTERGMLLMRENKARYRSSPKGKATEAKYFNCPEARFKHEMYHWLHREHLISQMGTRYYHKKLKITGGRLTHNGACIITREEAVAAAKAAGWRN